MDDLKSLCEKVLKDAEKATARPWVVCDEEGYETDAPNHIYRATAVNSSERLAKAVIVLIEALESFSQRDGDFPYARDVRILSKEALTKANEIAREG